MNQLSMFDETTTLVGTRWTPAARLTDPETSRIAAETNLPGRTNDRTRVLELLRRVHPDGLTDYELAALTGKQQNSIGKRRSELTAAGLVEFAGFHRPSPTGSPCRVWKAVDNV